MALRPPVSAMKGRIAVSPAAMARAMAQAVSVPPVNATPAMRGSETRVGPIVPPSPGSRMRASAGTPAWCSRSTTAAAVSEVASAGLAMTLLPAASAAASWPVKMASGKFQGLMVTNTPRGCSSSRFFLAGGAGEAGGLGQEAAGRRGSSGGSRSPRASRRSNRRWSGRPRGSRDRGGAGVRGQFGRTVENGGPLRHRHVAPAREAGLGAGDGALGGGDIGEVDLAQDVAAIGRVAYRMAGELAARAPGRAE